MISLLNRICRGIEDAWTAGFIQLLIIAVLAYAVANTVVSRVRYINMQNEVEQQYNKEHATNFHHEVPSLDLLGSLWDSALPIILITFLGAYEVRRRSKRRSGGGGSKNDV